LSDSQLRQSLPASIDLRLGGSGVQRQPGVIGLSSLHAAVDALAGWHGHRQLRG